MGRPTVRVGSVGGNLLFERAIAALGFDDTLMRTVLGEALAGMGVSPLRAAPQDLGMLLPEIERRLLLLAPHERVAPGIGRLRQLLLSWETAG